MRSSRMRGYGAWKAGWREGERRISGSPPGNSRCGTLLGYGFILLLVFSCFKVAFESGNPMGILFGLAVIAGVIKAVSR